MQQSCIIIRVLIGMSLATLALGLHVAVQAEVEDSTSSWGQLLILGISAMLNLGMANWLAQERCTDLPILNLFTADSSMF